MELVRIGELAKRSGLSMPTLKFYLREKLLVPTRRTGKTMALYDAKLVVRLRSIKELQQRQFLPLDVIRDLLERDDTSQDDATAARAIAEVLARHGGQRSRHRDEILARGANPLELEWLARAGLAVPDEQGHYRGDDLGVLVTLGAARRAGLGANLLPFEILGEYLVALNRLVEIELKMFRSGVVNNAKRGDLAALTSTATGLSEQLVVLLRRKLLLPTLERLIAQEEARREAVIAPVSTRRRTRSSRVRRKPVTTRRRRAD